ncbi:GerAB/ArcD/ProY family transporter [Inediibacterium massiliense]|uniref:GerAB/ArcD/ProY family transporter n=1 Tax=Inediibacterium massiliense TaxID=1658111 RepID=UPI0006B51C2E|nr:endospore germination permease [Inediibacterium massiliense]
MKQILTHRQISFIVFGLTVGYGLINLPQKVAEDGGTRGWVSLVFATLVTIFFTYIILKLSCSYPNQTIEEYSKTLTNGFFSSLIVLFYIIYFFISFCMMTRITCETIKLTILIKTPIWVLSFSLLMVVYYAMIHKIFTVGRICEIYGTIIIIGALFLFFSIFLEGEWIHLRPFFEVKELPKYIYHSTTIIFSFLGIEILIIIPIEKKVHTHIYKYILGMILFIGFFYILDVEACISVMGAENIVYYNDALLATLRRIDIKGLQFIRRLDGIFIIIWIMSVFCSILIEAYATAYLIHKKVEKISFSKISFFVISMGFLVSLVPATFMETEEMLDIVSKLGIWASAVIPTILLMIEKVKKNAKKSI